MGALTSKPYAFMARPWELQSINSFDFFDVFGSAIRLDFRGSTLMRVLPRVSDSLNEEWITDKVRFSLIDGSTRQRITNCYFRKFSSFSVELDEVQSSSESTVYYSTRANRSLIRSNFEPGSFRSLFNQVTKRNEFLGCGSLLFSIGDFSDLELASSIKKFLSLGFDSKADARGSVRSIFSDFLSYPTSDWRSDFYFPFRDLAEFESSVSVVIFVCFEPMSVPLLNVRFRRMFKNSIRFFSFGCFNISQFDYEVINLGSTWSSFLRFIEGRTPLSISLIKNSSGIVFVLGDYYYSFFSSFLPNSIFEFLRSKLFFNLCYFPSRSSVFNSLELSLFSASSLESYIVPFRNNSSSVPRLFRSVLRTLNQVNNKQSEFTNAFLSPNCNRVNFFNFGNSSISPFKTYQTAFYIASHSTSNLSAYEFVLPAMMPFEKTSTFINFQGKVQSSRSVFAYGIENRPDWAIFSFLLLCYFPSKVLLFDRTSIIEFFNSEVGSLFEQKVPFTFNHRPVFNFLPLQTVFNFLPLQKSTDFDYFLSDPVSQSSPLMALRSKLLKKKGLFSSLNDFLSI